jgi:hypothetical protein
VSDGRSHTLKKADPVEVESERARYHKTADTIDDVVTKLKKLIDGAADANVGDYADKLKDGAKTIQDNLTKAGKRYRDAADRIHDYQPQLDTAITELKLYETNHADAEADLTAAKGMPDPQKGSDGKISTEEQQKATAKQGKIDDANGELTAASDRLTRALDALDVAGKTLGDAVNCNQYDDGLTDSTHDKIMEAFGWISKIFGYLALAFTILAFLIPGVGALAIAGVVAGAVLLVADSVLLAGGEGSVLNVILDAVGLGLAGFGAGFSKLFSKLGDLGKLSKGFAGLKLQWLIGSDGKAALQLIVPGKPLVVFGPKPYFFSKPGLIDFFKGMSGSWWKDIADPATWKNLASLKGIGSLFNVGGAGALKWIWGIWGVGNNLFNLGAGVAFAAYQIWQAEHEAA